MVLIDKYKLLKSLEPAVKDSKILISRAPNPLTKTLQREALTAFLIAVALEKSYEEKGENVKFSVCENDGKNDGKIYIENMDENINTIVELEQIMLTGKEFEENGVPSPTILNEALISKIAQKTEHGYSNPERLVLTLFNDTKGISTVDELKKFIKEHFKFMFYVYIFLEKTDPYTYVVINLQPDISGHSEFVVTINDDFQNYSVNLKGIKSFNLIGYLKIWLYKITKFIRKLRGKSKT
ncbi:MAG: hypothetical protein UR96_C0046G0006 [candidate division WS6 bacterium GW2011_GWC1_36_11]|uniref:Uncharacterized protein n=1 Tax=candidate division WS6 bacterium GW2011_GWC1_36_11 TaxID=1619090 RepID=A0A0G0FSG1_9BACT|nr:MAG: hypothetical protein UR96_C0046G0006 [candidate division WS6 bacterium GW2011_GWC1_36_11]HAM96318.1 hypothetical protein [Patescibacteria group bacterium]